MLLKFSVENFRSIKDKATLSMVATEDTTHEETLMKLPNGMRVLKVAEIYGANGSGKSSILKALVCMMSISMDLYSSRNSVSPHILRKTESTFFDCYFTGSEKKSMLYHYQIEVKDKNILNEKLSFSDWDDRETMVFSTSAEDEVCDLINPLMLIISNERKESILYQILDEINSNFTMIKKNKLHLSKGKKQEILGILNPVMSFVQGFYFSDNIGTLNYTLLSQDEKIVTFKRNYNFSERKKLPKIKEGILQKKFVNYVEDLRTWLRLCGIPIVGLKVGLSNNLSETVTLIYNNGIEVPIENESEGTQYLVKLFAKLSELFLNPGALICIDELENHIHPLIVRKIIDYITHFAYRDHLEDQCYYFPQMICTTHNSELLDLSLVRKDQIWFTEINQQERNTELFSLSEFNEVTGNSDIHLWYLEGRFGAVPNLDSVRIKENY